MWQPQSAVEPAAADGAARTKNPGRRFGQVVRLKAGCAAEYKARHAQVWPEVAQQIKACNIVDYTIWYDEGTSLLFASFKYIGYDYAGDMQRMADSPKVRDWWALTDALQESLVPGATGSAAGAPGWWKPMEEVFHQP
ncbi:hypothetical protein CDD83_4743 [Cordyceps sp. RAO-2017]|nr:hypothetical protein CDD83_4743 [Cordyceps sp. RAO-2017]